MQAAFFAFDVETTGLDARQNEIISLAYQLLDKDLSCTHTEEIFVFPEHGCSAEAAEINGYTREDWEEKGAVTQVVFQDRMRTVLKRAGRAHPLGYNVKFDLDFLTVLFEGSDYRVPLSYHAIDVMNTAMLYDFVVYQSKQGRYRLVDVCARFGVGLLDAHTASADIEATVELHRTLLERLRTRSFKEKSIVKESSLVTLDGGVWVFQKGKHRGATLAQVATHSVGYLKWMLTNVDDLSEDQKKAVDGALSNT